MMGNGFHGMGNGFQGMGNGRNGGRYGRRDFRSQRGSSSNSHASTITPNSSLDSLESNNDWKRSVTEFKFTPESMALGSLTGHTFTPMLRGRCKPVPDHRKQKPPFLAFDVKRELLVMYNAFDLFEQLPPALRPLDAELPFCDIASGGIRVVETPQKNGRAVTTVTVTFRRPPRFYTRFEQSILQLSTGAKTVYRRRATAMDFTTSSIHEKNAGVLKAIPEGPCALPTYWNAFRWTLALNVTDTARLRACVHKLSLLNRENPDRKLLSTSARGVTDDAPRDIEEWVPPNLSRIPFATRTLVEGLIGNGILRPMDASALLVALNDHARSSRLRQLVLEDLFTEERICYPEKLVKARAHRLRQAKVHIAEHIVMIRTVQVTPTRVLIGPPQIETSNSVTRRYRDKLDAIIRVQFGDEGDRLHVLDYTKQADQILPSVGLMARVRRALQHGVEVGGKRYYPVASSLSQQKDHSIWFMDHTAIDRHELSNWMGRVKETVVAKYSARMGLPFSSSRLVDVQIKKGKRPDIEPYGECFTDGCSIAGQAIMKAAALALDIKKGIELDPSAIQFRLGGAKGVLSCWPDLVLDHEVLLRPSQVKFDSKLQELNVIRVAKYQTAFLNRQFIMIMSANNVPDQLFLDLFAEAVSHIKGMPERVSAGHLGAKDLELMKRYTEFPLKKLIESGFHKNPIVHDICRLIECRTLQDLKWRGRINVTDGVYVFGIADELQVLAEGEIFCQYQEDEDHEPVIVTGEVLVCRAPALHPGDVRRARAVDHPELHHLRNVVVFSTRGSRPLPNMLGGGDLDGDDYTIIWDQRFVKPFKEYEPMDYSAPKPLKVDQVTQVDLNENFVQYILNDILGQVDNAHLAWSDAKDPFDPVCLRLSETHSMAVDFAKTGQAATLDPDDVPKHWPDFMGKLQQHSYMSEKVLGQIFRMVDNEPFYHPYDIRQMGYPVDACLQARHLPLFPDLLLRLAQVQKNYEHNLQATMRRFRVHEVELVAGIAVQNKQRKRSRELHHLREPLEDSLKCYVLTARESALATAHVVGLGVPGYTLMQVVAWHAYALTYHKVVIEAQEREEIAAVWGGHGTDDEKEQFRPRRMVSFAWVFWEELVEIVGM